MITIPLSRMFPPWCQVAFVHLLTLCSLSLQLNAQPVPTHAGRPFIRVSRESDAVAGHITGFGRAQVVGDSVVFVALNGANASGMFKGRGGLLTPVAAVGTAVPGGTLQVFHDGFARDTTGGAQAAFAAGGAQADALYLSDGTTISTLLTPGSVLPNSGNKTANVLGEPFLVGDGLAVIAAHRPAGGTDDFRGVYRVKAGALAAVADTATELPGLGVPDGFSSQVGFDGQAIAFWATRGPFTENEGLFVQAGEGPVKLIARNGDAFPDGGVMDGFISPPFVAAGIVYFYARDAAGATRLLKFENDTLTVLAKDGDLTPEGDLLQSLGQFGLAVEAGNIFFPALTAKGAGLYMLSGSTLQTIVTPGVNNVAGLRPTTIVLQDLAGDTLALELTDSVGNRRLAANLASPAVPVILSSPTNQTVAPGTRVEFQVSVLGEPPFAYLWQFSSPTGLVTRSTNETLVIEAAAAADIGFYSLRLTNRFGGTASPSFQLNVSVAPSITADLMNTVIEAGDSLALRVTATGGLPLAYAWLKDGAPAISESVAAGQFVRTTATPADAGRYTVIITNEWGMATSAGAVVTVNPAPPNPVFGGGRFVKVVDEVTRIPGSEAVFATQSLGEISARFLGDQIAFVSGPAGQPHEGVFAWQNGTIVRLLGAGITLPNGLGVAEAFNLVAARANEALAVGALKMRDGFLHPVGLYRYNGSVLDVIADMTTAVPGGGGALFPPFWNGAFLAGGKTLFGSDLGGKWALYQASDAGLSRVVSVEQDLPVVGTATINFNGFSYDGQTVTTGAYATQQLQVALRIGADGTATRLLAKGDTIPGTTDTIDAIGLSDTEGDLTTLLVFSSAWDVHVVQWRQGSLARVAGPGMSVGTLGTVWSLDTTYPKASGGRAFAAARVATPAGMVRGIVAAGTGGIEPVLFADKLDARRVASTYVVSSEGDRVLVLVDFVGGGRALYANVGPVDGEPLTLQAVRPAAGTLRLTVPPGAVLEAIGSFGEMWQPVNGTGEVEVSMNAAARYFRLRRD